MAWTPKNSTPSAFSLFSPDVVLEREVSEWTSQKKDLHGQNIEVIERDGKYILNLHHRLCLLELDLSLNSNP